MSTSQSQEGVLAFDFSVLAPLLLGLAFALPLLLPCFGVWFLL